MDPASAHLLDEGTRSRRILGLCEIGAICRFPTASSGSVFRLLDAVKAEDPPRRPQMTAIPYIDSGAAGHGEHRHHGHAAQGARRGHASITECNRAMPPCRRQLPPDMRSSKKTGSRSAARHAAIQLLAVVDGRTRDGHG